MAPQSFSVFAETAYDCLNEERSRRPDICEVVTRLEKALELQLAHTNMPDMAEDEGKVVRGGIRSKLFVAKTGVVSAEPSIARAETSIVSGLDSSRSKSMPCSSSARLSDVMRGAHFMCDDRSEPETVRARNAIHAEPRPYEGRHDNIVSLLGFCDDCGEMILVYEYASKRSLDLYLNDKDLTWVQRLEICIGAARGLAYLHNPGTIGYCDPLYVETGLPTKESDVYSFGVVLFELLCRRLSIGNNRDERQPLTELVRKCYKQNTMDEIIFGNIKDEINPHSLKAFTTIAYQCLMREQEQRPLMSKVVKVLESALQLQVSNVPPPPSLSRAEPSAS
ncbi:protein kinase, ATP binding site-containing protein [Tanacetum coccineum]|uniref:Protein kinase, ATP binding site-containing protein n=1 Tax=Tanacetum coccineum TaxID=301880 RepID=A0ABQ5AXS3_9ASTR